MWTRNYNNLINTVISFSSQGNTTTSTKSFGNGYLFNFKNAAGSVYEICTYSVSGDRGNFRSHPAFVTHSGSNSSSDTRTCTVTVIKDQTSVSSANEMGKMLVGFGSSAAAETYEDYKLGTIITGLNQNSATATVIQNADGTLTLNCQILITATSDITIQEVGIFRPMSYRSVPSSGGTSNVYYPALLNRIVLDEPISVTSGNVANVTFAVTTPKISIAQ